MQLYIYRRYDIEISAPNPVNGDVFPLCVLMALKQVLKLCLCRMRLRHVHLEEQLVVFWRCNWLLKVMRRAVMDVWRTKCLSEARLPRCSQTGPAFALNNVSVSFRKVAAFTSCCKE